MMKTSAVVMLALSMAACGGAPKTATERMSLEERAQETLNVMKQQDPTLSEVLMESPGYVVFPEIAKGGAIAGGAYGHGVLYERGQPTGVVKLQQASLGLQLGGQTFSELIILRNREEVREIKRGEYDLGADASVVALKAGAAGSASLDDDTIVMVWTRGGLMAELSISGQRLTFEPAFRAPQEG